MNEWINEWMNCTRIERESKEFFFQKKFCPSLHPGPRIVQPPSQNQDWPQLISCVSLSPSLSLLFPIDHMICPSSLCPFVPHDIKSVVVLYSSNPDEANKAETRVGFTFRTHFFWIKNLCCELCFIQSLTHHIEKRKGFSTSLADGYKRSFREKGCLKTRKSGN